MSEELKGRTKQFGLRIIKVVDALSSSVSGRAIARQLIRCGTSVGTNYRAACRARSKAEFAAKLGIVIEEADERAYWLEIVVAAGMMDEALLRPLHDEANELVAIMTASPKTAKSSIAR